MSRESMSRIDGCRVFPDSRCSMLAAAAPLADTLRCGQGVAMDERLIAKRIELLKTEHRDLDSAIDALLDQNSTDQLQIARLKKRKLRLRDEIAMLEDLLIPDIIA